MLIMVGAIIAACAWLLVSEESVSEPVANTETVDQPEAPNPAPPPVIAQSTPNAEPVLAAPSPPALELPHAETDESIHIVAPPETVAVEEYSNIQKCSFQDESPLVLTHIESTSTSARDRDAAMLAKASQNNEWAGYHAFLESSLAHALAGTLDSLRRNGFDPLWQESVFTQAMLRWRVLGTMPLEVIRTAERDASPMLAWMLARNDVMHEWLITIRPEDNMPRVFELLHDAWYGDAAQFEKYFNLALACAVVFDREVRVQHPPSSAGYDAQVTIHAHERFLWYVEKNEAHRLLAPIDRMNARDLVWVVSVPISKEEMDWALSNMRLRRQRWGEAYGMIDYLMERAVSGTNPYREYTFAEIRTHGGICGDQSYFCANTARAHGIPAMILTGDTDMGPHAWVALKPKADEWSTVVGRIGGVANGSSRHPQTGGQISEQEVWLWNESEFRSTESLAAIFRFHWIADLISRSIGDAALAESAIRRANQLGRNVPETWSRLHDLLASKTRDAEEPGSQPIVDMWTRFVSEMKAQFRDNPRMGELATRAEDEFIFPHIPEADARRTLARERRRLERAASEQRDLVAASLKREADLIAASGDNDAIARISRLYGSALRGYGDSVTGFKLMAEDYFNFVKNDPEHARDAVRDIELAFNRVIATGSTEWFRANTEVSIHRMITNYYRQVGDESKALTLERRLERQLRRAERGADQ